MAQVIKIESGRKIIGPIDLDIPLDAIRIELPPTQGDGFYLCSKDIEGSNKFGRIENQGQCQTAWNKKVAELGGTYESK
jgi:hypothetical protein